MSTASEAAVHRLPSIGWLGLGRMGSVMAGRLLDAGFDLAVWNRTGAKAAPLVQRGAVLLPDLRAAADRELIFSMVMNDEALDALHDTVTGVFSGERTGRRVSTWVDGSTVSVAAAERAAAAANAAGVAYASAPVSGNPSVVAAGRAIFAASGDLAAVDAAGPVLAALGRATHRIGEGSGANVVKLATNALLAVVMQALAEILVLSDRAGVPRGAVMAFINDSAVGSPFTIYKTPMILDLDFTPTFTALGQRKDIRLALEMGGALDVPMPVLSTTELAFSRLLASGLGDGKDLAAVLLQVARDAGLELQPQVAS